MIRLKPILFEEFTKPEDLAKPYFQEFKKFNKITTNFKYIGLKNKEHVFTSELENLGDLSLIISEGKLVARITEKYAYFGIVYTLNGLEGFDATVCKIDQVNGKMTYSLFDDADSAFSDKHTTFLNLIKPMV